MEIIKLVFLKFLKVKEVSFLITDKTRKISIFDDRYRINIYHQLYLHCIYHQIYIIYSITIEFL